MPSKFASVAALLFVFVGAASAQSPVFSPPNGSASTSSSTPQAFSGAMTAPQINGEITVDGKVYSTLTAAYAAASTASATAGDQTIRLGPGTFTIASTLTDPDNGRCINMYGSGEDSTIIRATATMTNMYFKDVASKPGDCIIQGMTWDANGVATNAINIQQAKGWTIERNKFRRIASGGEAIVMGTGSFGGATLVYGFKVLSNTCAFDSGDYPTNNYPTTVTTPLNCIHAYGTSYDNIYAFNFGWNHQHAGIVTTGVNARLFGNHFYTFPVTGAQVFFSAYDMDLGSGAVVVGNTFDTYGTAGIYFNGSNIDVTGNIFECTGGATYCTGLFAGFAPSTAGTDEIAFSGNQINGICGLTQASVATPLNWNGSFKIALHSSMHDNVGTDCNGVALQFHQVFMAGLNNIGGSSAASSANAGLSVQSAFAAVPTIIANSIAGQTADLLEGTDTTNSPQFKFTINGILGGKIGAVIASASTIAPTSMFVHVTGTTAINTITSPTGCTTSGFGCVITLIPDGLWSTGTSGNIAVATTAEVNKALIMTYDPATAKWNPSYTAGPPEMVAYLGSANPNTLSTNTNVPFSPKAAITITRIEWNLTAQAVGCTTSPVITVAVGGTAQTFGATIGNGAFTGLADGTQAIAAGAGNISLKVTTAPAGCTTTPGTSFSGVIHYVMQ